MFKLFSSLPLTVYIAMTILVSACEKQPSSPQSQNSGAGNARKPNHQVQTNFQAETEKLWSKGSQSCEQVIIESKKLTTSLQALLNSPNSDSLQSLQNQWKSVTLSYGYLYLFTKLAEMMPQVFPEIDKLNGRIAAYPVQPGYLDTFGPYLYSGLVNDIGVDLTPKNLENQHGLTDDSDVVLGLYSLEFMLFGESQDRDAEAFKSSKKLTQAQQDAGFRNIKEAPNFRRRTLVASQVKILNADIARLCGIIQKNTTTLSLNWRKVTTASRVDAIHQLLNSALAQTNDHIKQQLAKNTDAASADYHHNYVLTAQESAQLISNQLQALSATEGYIHSTELFALLDATSQLLSDFATEEVPWAQAQDGINNAIQLLEDIKKTSVDIRDK